MKTIRVGIIGFGLSGRYFHAPLIKAIEGYQITSVNTSRESEVKAFLPQAKVYSDPYELISSDDVDLVINCSPNIHHFSLSAEALSKGKHVVVEKPFVNSLSEGQELIKLAKQFDRVLSVFHNRRWDGDFLTITDLIKSGRLGKIKQFESHFDRWRPTVRPERWRETAGAGSGILFDLGSHLIDQALVLFGKPDSMIADIEKQKDSSLVDDYFHLILKYKEMRVILHSSSFVHEAPRFQIFGEKGQFIKYGLDPQEEQLKAGMDPRGVKFGTEQEKQFGTLILPLEESTQKISTRKGEYLSYYTQLYDAISTGAKNPVSAESALEVIEMLNRCFSENGIL